MNALLASLLCIAAAPTTHWFNAVDITEAPQNVAPGTYHAWAWTPTHAETQVTINGNAMTAAAGKAEEKSPWHWVKVGEVACPEGTAAIQLGPNVAAVALSTAADFNPAPVQARRRVLNTPEAVIDGRGQHARHTHTVFTMPEFHSAAEWEAYADKLGLMMMARMSMMITKMMMTMCIRLV